VTETATTLDIKQANRVARVDARVRRRRRQILAAATHLMQQSGFHAISMQSVADEARISVGLIYQYFGNKEDLLRGVVVDILEDFRDQIPQALALAGEDPVERLKTAFRTCCLVVDAKRAAVNLTYRESKTLPPDGLAQIKVLELETAEPIRQVYRDGVAAGVFLDIDARLVAHNMLLTAHGWALKYWNFSGWLTLDEFIDQELALLLASVRVNPPSAPAPKGHGRTPRRQ
jgi:AcrR family transcriptional regulator